MTLEEALAALGVRDDTLTPDEKAFLDEHGYLPLEGVFTDQGAALGARLVEIAGEEGELWLIDDFTKANGATRVVPGSHRTGRLPEDDVADPSAPHPDEVLLLGRAGTVVIFNTHTWHGGTRNRTDQPRRAVHAYFCRRDGTPQTDQRRYARPETRARLTDAAKFILDLL